MTAPLIDAHVHVWDPGRLRYPWLDGLPELRRGVRRLFQDEGAGFIVSAPVVAGLRETARAGLVFDATVRAVQLMELARVHDAVPELTLVIGHLGNPPTIEETIS
jgi:predicted TIM-barrel fold metal-dependent hydrolase